MIVDLGRWCLLDILTGKNYLPNCFIIGTGSQVVTGTTYNTFANAAVIAPLPTSSWSMNMTDPASTTSTVISVTCTLNLPLQQYAGPQITGSEIMLAHYSGIVPSIPTPITYAAISSAGIASNPSSISSAGYILFAYTPVTGTYNITPSSSVVLTWLWTFSINVG